MKEIEVTWDDGCAATLRIGTGLHSYHLKELTWLRPFTRAKMFRDNGAAEDLHRQFCPNIFRFRSTRMPILSTCAHCGRQCGDLAGGWGSINGEPLCHPNEEGRPDCYRLVTVYHHPLGHQDCQVTDGVKGANRVGEAEFNEAMLGQ